MAAVAAPKSAAPAPLKDGTPPFRPEILTMPEALPRPEPVTEAGNKSPYNVLGTTYRVTPVRPGFRERGLASWYGTKFHGQYTSNGEPYDVYTMTAAHKTLPIPCCVRVTNLENGRRLVLRVNDRGPFHEGRVMDLSYAAAYRLGYADKGTALIEYEVLDPNALGAILTGMGYYPKLVGMSPFTPMIGYRFLMAPGLDEVALTAGMLEEIELLPAPRFRRMWLSFRRSELGRRCRLARILPLGSSESSSGKTKACLTSKTTCPVSMQIKGAIFAGNAGGWPNKASAWI